MARTYEEFTAAIGNVVMGFGQIESGMSTLIAFQYSTSGNYQAFIADVLADDSFSYGLRCNAVRKVLVRNGLSEKDAEGAIAPLRKLGGTRNLIVHTGKVGFAGVGDGFLHPKKVDEVLDLGALDALFKRFDEEHAEASTMLHEWFERVSPYMKEFRKLEAEVMARAAAKPPEGDAT